MLYSNQEAFDLVVEKLVEQGKPSVQEFDGGTCVYFAYNGDKCAAGHLIPSELITKVDACGMGWITLCRDVPEVKEIAHSGFVCDLQNAHDEPALNPGSYYNWRVGWASKMRQVATVHGLDRSKLDRLADKEWQNNS